MSSALVILAICLRILAVSAFDPEPSCQTIPSTTRECPVLGSACCDATPVLTVFMATDDDFRRNAIVRTKPSAHPRPDGLEVDAPDVIQSLLGIPLDYCRDQNFPQPWTTQAPPTSNPLGALLNESLRDDFCNDYRAAFNVALSVSQSSIVCNAGVRNPVSYRSLRGTLNMFATAQAQCAKDPQCIDSKAFFKQAAPATDLPGWTGASWTDAEVDSLELAVETAAATFALNTDLYQWGNLLFTPWWEEDQDAFFFFCARSLPRDVVLELQNAQGMIVLSTFSILLRVTQDDFDEMRVPQGREYTCPWADIQAGDPWAYEQLGTKVWLRVPAGSRTPLQSMLRGFHDVPDIMSDLAQFEDDRSVGQFWMLPPDSALLTIDPPLYITGYQPDVYGMSIKMTMRTLVGHQNMNAPLTFCVAPVTTCPQTCAVLQGRDLVDLNLQYLVRSPDPDARGLSKYVAMEPSLDSEPCCLCLE